MEYGLGRWFSPDDRDSNYPMSAALDEVELPSYRYWRTGPVLDQGQTSSCVGQSWRQFLSSAPLMTKTGPDAMTLYRESQRRDEWPGEEPSYYGTSVRAGAKVLTSLGHLAEYRWAWDLDSVIRWVLTKGCVVLGTTWRESMFFPDKDGVIRAEGRDAGGHAYLLVGANRERGMARILNSWGESWGQSGRAWIPFEDLERLILEDGEASIALERKVA